MAAAQAHNSYETLANDNRHTHTPERADTRMTPLISVRANKVCAQAQMKVLKRRLMSENATFRLEHKAQQQQH